MIKKISLTGGIGSGKSTVMNLLKQLGYCVWDADVFATEAMALEDVRTQITNLLGQKAYNSSGKLDRVYVRQKVFSNQELRLKLEEILHPPIQKLFENRVNMLNSSDISCWVFYEASLIFEKRLQSRFDINVLITADDAVRTKRVQEARNLPLHLISQIMSQQMPTEEKKQFADFVIDNSGTHEELAKNVNKLILFLKNKLA